MVHPFHRRLQDFVFAHRHRDFDIFICEMKRVPVWVQFIEIPESEFGKRNLMFEISQMIAVMMNKNTQNQINNKQ